MRCFSRFFNNFFFKRFETSDPSALCVGVPSLVYSEKAPSYCPTLKKSESGIDETSTTVPARASSFVALVWLSSLEGLRGRQNAQFVSFVCWLSLSWTPIPGSTESLISSDRDKSSFMPGEETSPRAIPRTADRNRTRVSTRDSSQTRPEPVWGVPAFFHTPASVVVSVKPTNRKRSRTSRTECSKGSTGPLSLEAMYFIPPSVMLINSDTKAEPSRSFSRADNPRRFAPSVALKRS
mmetsp:Transcript_31067/g.65126  ORF Transcript_31067/g.65126 Transcript_31067/m.65126 type:complete len:237 (-) Transcript_31067:79-789(-)